MRRRRTSPPAKPRTWNDVFAELERRRAVVLLRDDRFYELRRLDRATAAQRRRALRVPAGERRVGRGLDSPVVQSGFGWRWDPAGGGLRLVKPPRRKRR